jgi:hypothetical protein
MVRRLHPQGKARIAQLVEQRIENPRVAGSNPAPGTTSPTSRNQNFCRDVSALLKSTTPSLRGE